MGKTPWINHFIFVSMKKNFNKKTDFLFKQNEFVSEMEKTKTFLIQLWKINVLSHMQQSMLIFVFTTLT